MMFDRFALKRLTRSDLTFFEYLFRTLAAGNQKAINLNADVFIQELYPGLSRESQSKMSIDLWIAGPNAATPFNLQRKIIKGLTYKNWRLDGELVHNPSDAPDRFNQLAAGDIALLAFEGTQQPRGLFLLLFQRGEELFDELSTLLGDSYSMVAVEGGSLGDLCHGCDVSASHPIWRVVDDEDVPEAAMGQAPALNRLRRKQRKLTLDQLRKARQVAAETGRLGEELVDAYLTKLAKDGVVDEYEWVSDINAIAPYDFRVRRGETWYRLEVKTTRGVFEREYHLSLSELYEMASGDEEYRIGRVYGASVEGATMRVSTPQRENGRLIVDALSGLPNGVMADGVTIRPYGGDFEEAVDLTPPPDHE